MEPMKRTAQAVFFCWGKRFYGFKSVNVNEKVNHMAVNF